MSGKNSANLNDTTLLMLFDETLSVNELFHKANHLREAREMMRGSAIKLQLHLNAH